LKQAGCEEDIRVSILGHLQRGGIPNAYDRVLATQFGVKAFEMILAQDYGKMVAYKHPLITAIPIKDVISAYNVIKMDDQLLRTARGIGICMGIEPCGFNTAAQLYHIAPVHRPAAADPRH